ncbi:MAG: hypothetical protein C4557_07810 [Anaerolineaceae bacterium]|jgi:hypothetical protein|nr:MAG: hypothetical protein C4557_07810 [Anaerolineaceae bacterium]
MTTIFDELRRNYGTASAEQKLLVLRRELLRPIVTVESSAHLLQTASDRICECLPEEISVDEFKNTVTWLNEAARDLHQILDALTEDTSQVQEQHGKE